ncbi:MAG: hypothetical protein O9264_08045 [Leptospira sp.]|nr:hypothetical protein [Leptospira sp.]
MNIIKIGITGSRKGLSEKQKAAFIKSLAEYSNVEIHHGDCLGVDDGIHTLLFEEKWENPKEIQIFIHPPNDSKQRSFSAKKYEGKDILIHSYATMDYLARNQKIVESCDELWAFPEGPEKVRSGTWATIRFAKKIKKPLRIFLKEGGVEK